MRTYTYNPPADELRALRAQIKQFVNKPVFCPWQQGDELEIDGRLYRIECMTSTVAFVGGVPERSGVVEESKRAEW